MTHKCPRCGGNMSKDGKTARGNQQWSCKSQAGGKKVRCYTTTSPGKPIKAVGGSPAPESPKPEFRKSVKSESGAYLITWAQNGTPVHEGFLTAALALCDAENAELVVHPGRYKNPTSKWTASQSNDEVWDDKLTPYLYHGRKSLNGNLHLLSDIRIQPTAVTPLTGFESVTGGESCIIPHPKFQAKTVATPSHRLAKWMMTTGAITRSNYTDSRAGKGGERHHVIGGLFVKVVSRTIFHIWQINYCTKNKGFIHLDRAYYADGTSGTAPQWEALVMGDAHWRFADPSVVDHTFGALCDRINPKRLVWHDLLDAYSCSPHHGGDPFKTYAKRQSGYDDVRKEVESTIDWMLECGSGRQNVIVPSNHDNMLKRWIVREDWKRDPVNAEFYLETALQMLRHTRMTEIGTSTPDPFQQMIDERGADNVHVVPVNGRYEVGGIALNLHGDQGPNGARGSRMNIRRVGQRTIIGHSHSPGAEEGCWQTGTMTRLSAEYTGPLGSWMNTHVGINAFDKRCFFTHVNKKAGFGL